MKDYSEDSLKPQVNADGKVVDREVKEVARIETIKLRSEFDADDNLINQTEHYSQRKKRTSKKGWGRMYEMDYMAALDLMIENSKLTFKVFKHLLENSGKTNHIKPMTQKDIAEHFGKSAAAISPIMKFFREYEIICKVSDGLMINPFLCAKNGVSDEELYRIQDQWDSEIGYYGQEQLKATLDQDIRALKAEKAKRYERLNEN